ncbi:MAG: hypothetical protein HC782_04905 [Gammaproteobacteria bacterium]|nr:hypothetical protein [Gammaproteobacteria bacterium]
MLGIRLEFAVEQAGDIGRPNGPEGNTAGIGFDLDQRLQPEQAAGTVSHQRGIGAALREANNALLNPNTSRRFGTIWIVILMSDGGAGASDPVRRNGRKLNEFEPYIKNSKGTFGVTGEYGAFGLCPIGSPEQGNPNVWGELVNYANDRPNPQEATTPFCADESPASRHTCDFRPLLTLPNHPSRNTFLAAGVSPLQDNDYKGAGDAGGPAAGSTAAQVVAWNRLRNNLYDVDIADTAGTYTVTTKDGKTYTLPRGGCHPLYDVEDYARDWADYIATANLGTTSNNTQVPTIFTIGFGIRFNTVKEPGTNTFLVTDSTKPLNDPVNAASAQTNVARLCELNIDKCLGEQLLRYIADIGDNNRLDHDYYQDLMHEWYDFKAGFNTPGADLESVLDGYRNRAADGTGESFGPRDACQTQGQGIGPVNNSYDKNNNNKIWDFNLLPSTHKLYQIFMNINMDVFKN